MGNPIEACRFACLGLSDKEDGFLLLVCYSLINFIHQFKKIGLSLHTIFSKNQQIISCKLNMLINLIRHFCSFTKTINSPPPRGKLSIIPTPIGNMDDISPNMMRALLTADIIGCQDRRVAGQLYSLIKNRNILGDINERFGDIGLTSIIPASQSQQPQQIKQHQFYNYSNMSDKQRRKFLSKMNLEQQNAFKIDYLKYRALKSLNKHNQFAYKNKEDKFDELYGIQLTDLKHIETQIFNCRKNKGRGILIPLNTYSQTKMFDFVRAFLQTKNVALVSDAGMPCISDPGWKLVNKIRNTMPQVPIEVIGGPSSVGIMTLQAALSSDHGKLSGRFEGFSNLTTGNFEENNMELKNIKMQEFSINFINAKKLKKRLLFLQTAFTGNHKVLLANELTKKYQRRFNGNISELIEKLSNDPDFQPIGQVSYLVYPQKSISSAQEKLMQKQPTQSKQQNLDVSSLTSANVSIKKLLSSIDKHIPSLPLKQKCNLLCSIFGIKQGQARKYVYDKFSTE